MPTHISLRKIWVHWRNGRWCQGCQGLVHPQTFSLFYISFINSIFLGWLSNNPWQQASPDIYLSNLVIREKISFLSEGIIFFKGNICVSEWPLDCDFKLWPISHDFPNTYLSQVYCTYVNRYTYMIKWQKFSKETEGETLALLVSHEGRGKFLMVRHRILSSHFLVIEEWQVTGETYWSPIWSLSILVSYVYLKF